MNVSVFSIGRFHHFNLGRQILRHGHQLSLFTSNPRPKVDRDLRAVTKTRPWLRIPFALGGRLGFAGRLYWLDEILLKDLGKWLERIVDVAGTDVFHAQDGAGPLAGRRIRESGRLWVCDRASTHIAAQREILLEEHARWSAPAPEFSTDRVERSIAEYREAHAITVPSGFVKASFVAQGIDERKVFICPYGVELSEFKPGVKTDDVFRILHVGQIAIRKGIGYLLQAVQPLVAQGKCELWLVGAIDSSALGLVKSFKGTYVLKGIYPREKLWQIYAQASVLVLASVEEGLALVLAQAMACGVPVIATRNTGAEDLITDGVEGFIVEARNAQAIHDCIECMRSSSEVLDRMGEAARERVKVLGGWDDYGERVESVYYELGRRHGIRLQGRTGPWRPAHDASNSGSSTLWGH